MSEAKEQSNKRPKDKVAGPTRSFDGSTPGPGSRIGPFLIEQELGRGGAGVVYLAHDTKLDRSVAIKSLPAEVKDNPKALSRFTREARVLASLNHPNIATIYDELEEVEGLSYLVLEYVSGQTLAERIVKGPLKLEEALTVALQIAEAVAAAHEHDVIHRDLKPGNIKITLEDKVKVLDFGLAKVVGGEATDQQTTITEPGRVIGTPAYMSPEQARGKPTDKRSDIWSFGCVLYEMLTGRVPFKGETISDTLANILQTDPEWHALPSTTPANILVLLRRCLEKDPRRRLRDIGDAAIEISDTLERGASSRGDEAIETGRGRLIPLRQVMLVCLVCLALGAVAAVITILGLTDKKTPAVPTTKTVSLEPLPPQTSLLISRGGSIAISADGKYLVYVGVDALGTRHLYLRDRMNDFEATLIRGTEGAICPFFRPDGEWIGFFAKDESTAKCAVKRVRTQGGVPEFICTVPPDPCGGSWGLDDNIIFSPIYQQSLVSVSAFGGERKIFISVDSNTGDFGHLWPHILPEQKGVLYTVWGGNSCTDYRTMIKWKNIDKPQELLPNSSFARYVPTGHVVFLREGSLQAVRFEIDHPGPEAISGETEILLEDIGVTIHGGAQFTFSGDGGILVYVRRPTPMGLLEGDLVWVDSEEPNATPTPIPDSRTYYDEWCQPRLSPDENWIAVTPAYETNLLLYKFGTGWHPPLVSMKGYQGSAVWEPSGRHVAFYSMGPDSPPDIYWRLWNNGDTPELLYKTENAEEPTSFSPDGKYLALTVHHVPETGLAQTSDIWILEIPTKEAKQWTNTPQCSEWGAAFSPDGKWIAYTSDEIGQKEVYVRKFPNGKAERVSISGGSEVMWGPDRENLELFYRDGKQLWRAYIETEQQFRVARKKPLFDDMYIRARFPEYRNYDISKDGKRFLMIKQVDEQPPPVTRLNVVDNWFEELKRRVPTGKNQ